jgi:hypothetical protein
MAVRRHFRMSISIHGPTSVSGSWNVLGTEDGMFILQGNLTTEQLKELRTEIDKVLKVVENS